MSESVLGGRYRLEARIGAGGMAEVYRGHDTVLDRTVAVKILLPQFARDTGFVERFRREAQAAARLNQQNIVGIYDTGADGDTQYIVMEFIEGRTLADFMGGGGRFRPMNAVEVTEKVCEALAYAHFAGVVHRDIKPANIMVTRKGVVKVMDFGIARIVAGPDTAPQTSAVLGTAAYISPEQAQGQTVDGRSDIYSLGVVLYEMLAGRPPFSGESPVAIAYKQVNEAPSPPSLANPGLPPSLDAVVMRALAKNPANRYQTADDFRADLERVRQGQEVLATPLMPPGADATQVIARPAETGVLPPQEAPPGSSRKVWLGVLIGIITVAVIAGGGYLLANGLLSNNASPTQTVQVPPLIDMTETDAISALDALHLQHVVKTRVTDLAKPGKVVDQDPPAQTTVDQGSTVTIWIAKAPTTVTVPDLTGMTAQDAASALAAVGLKLNPTTSTVPSDTVPVDKVASQIPPAGTDVPKGTEVSVALSSGPALVAVPDVTCLSLGQAKSTITAAGLVPFVGSPVPVNSQCPNPSRIAAEEPAAGTQVNAGTTVTIHQGEVSSPSPSGSPSP